MLIVHLQVEIERGQWAASYTSTQIFIRMFSYMLAQQLLALLMDFDWLV